MNPSTGPKPTYYSPEYTRMMAGPAPSLLIIRGCFTAITCCTRRTGTEGHVSVRGCVKGQIILPYSTVIRLEQRNLRGRPTSLERQPVARARRE